MSIVSDSTSTVQASEGLRQKIRAAAEKWKLHNQKQIDTSLFGFARAIMALALEASEIEGAAVAWMTLSKEHLGDLDRDEVVSLLADKLDKAHTPHGEAFSRCLADAQGMPEDQSCGLSGRMGLLVRLCRALQDHHGPGVSFPLPCRLAGEAIGRCWRTASAHLKRLCQLGIIEKTLGHRYTEQIAAEYRYLGDGRSGEQQTKDGSLPDTEEISW